MVAQAISAGVQGLAGIAGGIIGSGKRKREQRAAQQEMARAKARMMNLDTSNLRGPLPQTINFHLLLYQFNF